MDELSLTKYFLEVFGSPVSKIEAISKTIEKYRIDKDNAIMIGDSLIDYKAAKENDIFFALRKTKHNLNIQNSLDCIKFKDFDDG